MQPRGRGAAYMRAQYLSILCSNNAQGERGVKKVPKPKCILNQCPLQKNKGTGMFDHIDYFAVRLQAGCTRVLLRLYTLLVRLPSDVLPFYFSPTKGAPQLTRSL